LSEKIKRETAEALGELERLKEQCGALSDHIGARTPK
jgi:hypothetical protein